MKKLLTAAYPVVFLLSGILYAPPCTALTHMETMDLFREADLVVVGDIVSVEQGVESTRAQARLLQVLKGQGEAPGALVTIQSAAGKVYIDESQPSLSLYHASLYFLQKTPEGYVCVNQADGEKRIRGESIYPYHDNLVYSVPLKDYLKTLEVAAK